MGRQLKGTIEKIRENYSADLKSKEMRIRQRAVALYFIDKLALRAGNEKDEDSADTVGCCSLRVEHITLYQEKDGKENVVAFDFLGKTLFLSSSMNGFWFADLNVIHISDM